MPKEKGPSWNSSAHDKRLLPYVLAMIELDEGLRLVSNLTNVEPSLAPWGLPKEEKSTNSAIFVTRLPRN